MVLPGSGGESTGLVCFTAAATSGGLVSGFIRKARKRAGPKSFLNGCLGHCKGKWLCERCHKRRAFGSVL